MATPTGFDLRAHVLYQEMLGRSRRQTDRMFAGLLVLQWLASIALALWVSPSQWEGRAEQPHVHVWAALLLGGALTGLPVALTLRLPGAVVTRHVVACAQMLWSSLLIHLSGGRIETHFHVFGSLAFLSFYRDWHLFIPATLVVASDHLVRQLFWPESVYGVLLPEWWRFLEHAFWVLFEDVFLTLAVLGGMEELRQVARRQSEAEALSKAERQRSEELDEALQQLRRSQEAQVRAEKLAAVGKLAAGVGHELRNPLGAVRNANTYILRRMEKGGGAALADDPRVPEFLGVIDRELNACSRIISDLLDFARERKANLRPCPLSPLVDEAIALVPPCARVQVFNEVPRELPVPLLDKDQFRQVLINLVQNAVEAIPHERPGQVAIRAVASPGRGLQVRVVDDGTGIPPDILRDIFQPLFTTKTKGTGLGLAIVSNMVQRHGGSIRVESAVGRGTEFIIELPDVSASQAA